LDVVGFGEDEEISQVYYFIEVRVGSIDSAPFRMFVNSFYPSLFFFENECSSDYRAAVSAPCMQVARSVVTDVSGRLIDSSNPAVQGSYAAIWLTGLGSPVSPAWVFNLSESATSHVGAVPGLEGVYQMSFQVPDYASAAPCGPNVEFEIRVEQGDNSPGTLDTLAISGSSYLPVVNSGPGCSAGVLRNR
jgi:uncharacterized protein (TIGR03437 family)